MSKRTLWLLFPLAVAGSPSALAQAPKPEALTLRQAIERALAKAPELAVSRATAEEGAASARLAGDAFAPEAFFTTTPGYASGLPIAVAGRVPAVAGVEIRQTLYNPSRRSQALEARAQAVGLEGALERSRMETARAVLVFYARSWADQVLVECAGRRLKAQETILRRLTALAREGRRTELDVERAALQVARAKQKLLDYESDRDLDQLELRRIVDWPAHLPLMLAEDPISALPEPTPEDTLSVARAADPELRALELELEILGRSERLQAKRWAPVIDAEAQYSRLTRANKFDQFYLRFKADDWSVGLSLAVPLWTGGRFEESKARARARLARLHGERQMRESNLEILARRAESAMNHAVAQVSLARRSQGVAQEALRLARLLAQEGREQADDVEESEMALADGDEEVTRSSLELFVSRVRLLALRGELSTPIGARADTAGGPALSSR